MIDKAIRVRDAAAVTRLLTDYPNLLHVPVVSDNRGPPMSHAANMDLLDMVKVIAGLGAKDFQHAFDRALLHGDIETAEWLHTQGAVLYPGNSSAGTGHGGMVHLSANCLCCCSTTLAWATGQNDKKIGFYVGGGINYVMTRFTDTAGYSKKTFFFGAVVDGGIRFNKIMDLNIETALPVAKTID